MAFLKYFYKTAIDYAHEKHLNEIVNILTNTKNDLERKMQKGREL